MTPLFSIIIPTYNRANLISKAIQSVLDQSYSNWELLIIDNRSTDNTRELVSAYDDQRIQYYYMEIGGRGPARNKGLKIANGDWVCFLDSDDWYKEDHLEVFQKGIESNPDYSIFKTGVIFETEDGEEIFHSKFIGESENQIDFILRNYSSVLDLCISSKISKSHSFPDLAVWEDKAFMIDLFSENRFFQLKQHTVFALEHPSRSILALHKNVDLVNNTLIAIAQKLKIIHSSKKVIKREEQRLILGVLNDAQVSGLTFKEFRYLVDKLTNKPSLITYLKLLKLRMLK